MFPLSSFLIPTFIIEAEVKKGLKEKLLRQKLSISFFHLSWNKAKVWFF
jgi:hypothetical protein